ncbi:adenylate/guanylate cyclase domain-containing protein [Leptospira sp. 2 VSF19]|uniref:Adenylate/guanylate cyclase domain-containing protein n=1 Tax=Leptospira soteropolitanensis TaxID=2950025 RepID=A0AAW5VLZ6_9LEPT|nr:adenylate/guanylate cyclase domain-containing protein [Leptospira soteropolitanensis]MCW7494619.1 adenylate/guanylate cyclase domain-containing protein [Leptospira soteropolitanensis]MCW7502213.1 adenylate/guanylate cyclase domain-containing protein [Leptospira soteropolitanensis]MCW7524465.1 adenylate/guanylate cyclase domain-containing protein [Leptospira soteropolitanensis]MCW7528331.1 adenylate/guanylate cyclase domain-containing protein [Leptospira soteropolitanensis]MCW7532184.1 adeny
MKLSLVDEILIAREMKNEKTVAFVRFALFSVTSTLDSLSYFGWINYTIVPTSIITVGLDILFLIFATLVLLILFFLPYKPYLKFFTITLDYFIIGLMIFLDPTILKGNGLIYFIAMTSAMFVFQFNLLRNSKAGTIYGTILAIVYFLVVSIGLEDGYPFDLIPMMFGLAMMLGMGYLTTVSNIEMVKEANAKQMMERYLPSQLVSEFYKNKAQLEPGGENKEVTILFSDIRSFTKFSEQRSAEEVVHFLNHYLSRMTDIIFKFNGTIDKFIGDAIMTIFGAPFKRDDDALRAVKTAVAMICEIKKINETIPNPDDKLQVGIGIHTGEAIVGNIGSDRRLDYTVIGDNVNLASRIEGLTKHYRCSILISEATYKQLQDKYSLGDGFEIREIDQVIVKGKSKPITVYEVVCL